MTKKKACYSSLIQTLLTRVYCIPQLFSFLNPIAQAKGIITLQHVYYMHITLSDHALYMHQMHLSVCNRLRGLVKLHAVV